MYNSGICWNPSILPTYRGTAFCPANSHGNESNGVLERKGYSREEKIFAYSKVFVVAYCFATLVLRQSLRRSEYHLPSLC